MRFIANWTSATLLAIRDLTPGIREFLLRPDGYAGAPYPIGSHIDVGVTIDGQPQTRSYSLVGEVDPQGFRIAVRRAPDSRGGSHYMWSLAPGARLNITQPASLVQLDWTRRQFCLIAGGIGITPIVGAAQALARRDAGVTLHYSVRTRSDAAYLDMLESLLGDRLVVHAGDEGRRLDFDGVFAALPRETMTMFCGPMRMLDAARLAWEASDRPMTDLRYETFGSSGLLPTEAFRVRVRNQGTGAVTEFVIPRDRSMLDVLDEAGHEVMSDCRRGECGVCALDVVDVDGEIDHRDVFFSAHQKQESRKICACVSRARGTITVDTLHRADAF